MITMRYPILRFFAVLLCVFFAGIADAQDAEETKEDEKVKVKKDGRQEYQFPQFHLTRMLVFNMG